MKTILLVTLGSGFLLSFQNCAPVNFDSMSEVEAKTLTVEPFNLDINSKVAGVTGADGLPSENLRLWDVGDISKNWVQDCSAPVKLAGGIEVSRFEYEKAQALNAAAADPEQKTIPIEFAMSFGQKEDRLAHWAHERAILTEGNDSNTSIVPVGPKNGSMYKAKDKNVDAYYVVDHKMAKENYIWGSKCFFDTVKIKGDLHEKGRAEKGDRYDFISSVEKDAGLAHKIHYMYYGWCDSGAAEKCADEKSAYGKGNYGADTYPNRLFDAWPHEEAGAPQIVKLYVADLRDGHFGLSKEDRKIVRIAEGTKRGAELQLDAKTQLDLKAIFRDRGTAIWNLSNGYKSPETKEHFAGMRGVPQLLSNIMLAGANGTVLATQYTPIVLDLGEEKVRTSSVFGGTFFNMAAKSERGPASESFDFTQATAWLGGSLVDTMDKAHPRPSHKSILADFRRVVDDGFLVITDADGKVSSSRNMFGDKTVVDGKTYSNGFEALQALTHKDCSSVSSIKDKYFGPWDGETYSTLVKVWVDANRNAVVDEGEIKSLKDSGVYAINTCNVVHKDGTDSFGNGTSLRSAFLFEPNEDLSTKEDEIISRLETGKKSSGEDAKFRLAIDLIFKVQEDVTLE